MYPHFELSGRERDDDEVGDGRARESCTVPETSVVRCVSVISMSADLLAFLEVDPAVGDVDAVRA